MYRGNYRGGEHSSQHSCAARGLLRAAATAAAGAVTSLTAINGPIVNRKAQRPFRPSSGFQSAAFDCRVVFVQQDRRQHRRSGDPFTIECCPSFELDRGPKPERPGSTTPLWLELPRKSARAQPKPRSLIRRHSATNLERCCKVATTVRCVSAVLIVAEVTRAREALAQAC